MKALFLRKYVWYETRYEAGKVYDLEKTVFAYLLAEGVIEPLPPEVERLETQEVPEPVATSLAVTEQAVTEEVTESKKIMTPKKSKRK